MTEPKFTPGPWGNVDFALSNEIGTLKNPLIAVVQSRHCDSPDELRANAHLIAAAPELYEALEECAIDLKEWILGRYPEESLKYPSIKKDFELDISIVDKAFSALAKARGESHD